ncbi:hypothetical protein ABPG74_006650 [Tetrahymena malaccensis]
MDIVQNQLEASQVLEVNQKCPTHLNKDIEWIRLGVDNDPCVLKCSKCLDKKAGFVDYIYIEDLIESRDDFTFEGWPLQNEPQILQKIKEIASRVSEVDEIKNKIRNAFKNIRMKIDSQLEEKQEEMFKFIDHQKDLLKEYNKICQKEKLIDIVRNMHQNFEKSNQMLIEIIKENNKNQDVNKQVFLNYIQDFNEIIKLDVNAYTKIENNLCEAIKNQNWQIKILDKTEKNICKGFGNQNQQQQIDAPQQEIINRNYVIKVNGLECLSQCVNKKIVDFDFRKSQIDQDQFQNIFSQLEKCQDIRYLNLNLSQLSLNLFQDNIIFEETTFDYDECYIFWLSISNNIQNIFLNLPNIAELELDLSFNAIHSDVLNQILSALQNCKKITKLNLNLQNIKFPQSHLNQETFGTAEVAQLEKMLKKLTKITQLRLNLSSNNLRNKEFMIIARALKAFKHFDILNLNFSHNQIENAGLLEINDVLLNCENIGYLDLNLSFNQCSQAVSDQIVQKLLLYHNIQNSQINIEQGSQSYMPYQTNSSISQNHNISHSQLKLYFPQNNPIRYQNYDINQRLFVVQCLKLNNQLQWNLFRYTLPNPKRIIKLQKNNQLNLNLQNIKFPQYHLHLVAFGTAELAQLGKMLKQLTKITQLRLNLSSNNLRNKEFMIIARALKTFQHFDILNLNFSFNKCSDSVSNTIEQQLRCYENIKRSKTNIDQIILDEDPDFLSLQPKTQFTNQSNFPIKFYEYQIPKFIIPEQIMDDTILLKKICLVGYYCAGKDCILGRLQKIGFLSETKATIGTEYSNIIFALKNGQKINLQIQNASGNKKYQEIVYKYTRGTSGFVFCFDITEKKSFEELKEELPKIKEYGVPILILGNKIDLYERRQVDTQLVIDLANQNNLALAICSAKTGENIQEPFDNLAEEIFRRHVIEKQKKNNNNNRNQKTNGDFGLAHQIKDPLKENTISSLNGNLNYKSPEVYKEEKPYTLKVDVFSIGAVILQCLLEGKLKVHQFISLKSQLLVKVIPDIKTHPNYDFIEKIISCMINFKKEERLEPLKLIQKLNSIYMQKIDVKCLNELVLPKKQEFSQPKVKKSVSSVKQTSYIHEQQTKIQNFESMQYQQVQQLPVFYKTYSQPNFSLNNFLPPNPNQGRIYKIKKITAITPIYYNFDQQNQMYGQMTSAPYTPQNQQYSKPPQKKYPDDYYDY